MLNTPPLLERWARLGHEDHFGHGQWYRLPAKGVYATFLHQITNTNAPKTGHQRPPQPTFYYLNSKFKLRVGEQPINVRLTVFIQSKTGLPAK